ncbi:type II toxin-antitoxin system RelE/ParE family toxin [Tsukamurella sp. NPDC003166]|uniref:type II toxin-antitoxin system RelE/ParE family toxin n=1 Tax=Tsukamurella sp. NPDC003166 TaxID=3154444 RepID=UPI0033A059E6
MGGPWDIDTDLVDDWIRSLSTADFERVLAALEYLAERGPTTGRPFVDTVRGSQHANMKELRTQGDSSRSAFRLLFAFDLQSRAIVLVAGDKAGNWEKWYAKNIPIADALFTDHQAGLRTDPVAPSEPGRQRRKKKK